MSFALMVGLVPPLCKYLESDHSIIGTLKEVAKQVSLSFTFDESKEITISTIGKTFAANFLFLYSEQFYSTQFIIFSIWLPLSFISNGSRICPLSVIADLCLELLVLTIRKSYFGFIFDIFSVTSQAVTLIIRYITFLVQYKGCSAEYVGTIANIVFFIPRLFLNILEFIRFNDNFIYKSREKDGYGRFIKKKR